MSHSAFWSQMGRAESWLARIGTAVMIALSALACGGSAGPEGASSDGGKAGASGSGAGSAVGGGAGASAGRETDGGNGGGGTGGKGGTQAGGAPTGGAATGGIGTVQACDGSGPQLVVPLPSGPVSGGSCRTQADCSSIGQCVASLPTGSATCGACFPTVRQCGTDDQCGAGQVCVTFSLANPCQCMGPDMRCVARCTADSCGADQVCGADGRCTPKSCDQGYVCPSGTVCDPQRATGHGCAPPRCDLGETTCGAEELCDPTLTAPPSRCRAKRCSEGAVCAKNLRCGGASDLCERLPCQTDAECDCGACIQRQCQDHLFVCFVAPL